MLKHEVRTRNSQSGFTLMEVLVTVAIIICLLALSAVAIPKYLKHLQITELDIAAREIYMAAQNEAILLRSSGELKGCVIKSDGSNVELNKMENVDVVPNAVSGTPQITAYYVKASDLKTDLNAGRLLPETSIEGELWDGEFYIVYEPVSGSVIDVFYAEKGAALNDEVGSDFRVFYDKWRVASKEERMNHDPMIGYYGGESGESGTSISLRTPVINIYNEDTLRAEVTYWVPRTLAMINSGIAGNPDGNVELKVDLEYEGQTIPLSLTGDRVDRSGEDGIEYLAITYTWLLDSMEQGKQFQDLFEGQPGINAGSLEMGKDFTITASVSYKEDGPSAQQVNGAKKSATDNSLFAKGSDGETAQIAYMRHLQNLDKEFSGVEGKVAAVQTANIACGSEENKDYKFIPIENSQLAIYHGDGFEIRELHAVLPNAQDGISARTSAGLFGSVENMDFADIKLVNTNVDGAKSQYTGALVGYAKNSTIEGCQIYWENTSAASTNLRDVLGNSEAGIKYMVRGSSAAGGLAGAMDGGTIKGSFASTTIKGDTAGGLIGKGAGTLTITGSYGDSYLEGQKAAGGLIGTLPKGSHAAITDAYAVGFIKGPDQKPDETSGAGFCLGSGTITSNRAYSAMLFTKGAKNYALSPNTEDSTYTNTYYLTSTYITEGSLPEKAKSYGELTDPDKIVEFYGADHHFEMKNVQHTNPYNLQTTLNLTSYSYPGLKEVDHYGDWGAEFQSGSLVYYERYTDGGTNYAFNGGNLNLITDEQYAVEDGYALAFLSTDIIAQSGLTVNVKYLDNDGKEAEATLTYKNDDKVDPEYRMRQVTHTDEDGVTKTYYLLPLPKEIVCTEYASENFYQEFTFSQGSGDNAVTGHYYYNPHFANAVLPYEEGVDPGKIATQNPVQIRTARHLYMLSAHSEYYASAHQYDFVQGMNIDYSIYEGYDLFPKKDGIRVHFQNPIGEGAKKPFRGSYYGGCHTIENVGIKADSSKYVGLFGYSIGDIEDTTYIVNEQTVGKISSQRILGDVYVGGLAGYNGGTIDNCAVAGMEIDARAYNFSTVYAGGLVGWNRGTIQNSSAALTELDLETNLAGGYAGGFVGLNTAGATVRKCYAVGRINAEQSKYGEVFACGFAGSNGGSIRQCYAATDLESSGEVKVYGFCSDENGSGTYNRNYYMNDGNFRYNGVNYTAQYEDSVEHAEPKKYSTFKSAIESTGIYDEMSMKTPGETKVFKKDAAAESDPEMYPYPGAVKDADENYIHYGMWPELMDLNQGGIYYWEKMVNKNASGKEKTSYHMSAIILDPDNHTVEKIETLSTKHNDGCVITEYGYGYFAAKDIKENTLTSDTVAYGGAGGNVQSWDENTECNEALVELLKDENSESYEFHSYNTWSTKEEKKGLYVTGTASPYGTWKLKLVDKNGTESVTEFCINPFFADSMSLSTTAGWKLDKSVPVTAPGSDINTPFYVRSVEQLQFINWNGEAQDTSTVLIEGNRNQFPFLGYNGGPSRDYFWKQSHDLQGGGKTYSPIAELYDKTNGNIGTLYGWFGGTYDGDDYVIQDVNIQGHASSCTGLFGMVYNGTLKNIIMYSPTGKGTVSSEDSGVKSESAWYAIGGLAGFAATSSDQESAIENCSIAGYTIKDSHIGGGAWGGTCMGGLIGVSCMNLEGCTAVTQLKSTVVDNDNVRIGGLVGSCQESISNCYAGGEVDVTGVVTAEGKTGNDERGIYVGGIVGGVYFKPLVGPGGQIGDKGKLTNTIRNCYSYVTLPDAHTKGKDKEYIRALYAVGGPGEITRGGHLDDKGYTTYENCYYLENVTWSKNGGKAPIKVVRCDTMLQWIDTKIVKGQVVDLKEEDQGYEPAWPDANEDDIIQNDQVTAMTYAKMSDGTLLTKLNGNIDAGDEKFGTVTTETSDKYTINGKYSFTSDPSLVGRNYPFPTILTQNDEGELVNVHYGAWPVEGLIRESGSVPIDIDLFADYHAADKEAKRTEKIMLSSLINTGGDLTYTIKNDKGDVITEADSPVKIELDEDGFKSGHETTMTLTGKKAGLAQIEVVYTLGENTYTVLVDVQVTAELQLLPKQSPVKLFTSETAWVALDVTDRDGQPIEEKLLEKIAINMENSFVERDGLYLGAASLGEPDVIQNQGDKGILLTMTSLNKRGGSKVTLNYEYAYLGEIYTGSNPVSMEIEEPKIELAPITIYLAGADSVTGVTKECRGSDLDLKIDEIKAENVKIIDVQNGDGHQIFAEWMDKENGVLNITVYEKTTTLIQLKLRFELDGVTHEIWQYLKVNVEPGNKPEEGTP